jgi:pimeloyl-ACP methyl ester carboxylesterase
MTQLSLKKVVPGLVLGAGVGWFAAQAAWALWKIARVNVPHTLAAEKNQIKTGLVYRQVEETETFTRTHTVEDGIERIVYTPKKRRFQTPILMQHGMWHGAWCWHLWRAVFAEWGWETIAFSLPGHANSPEQRPIRLCTLDYYLSFLKAEVERLPRKPVLMGHSMGGALAQWYLKYVGDDLPAAVLVAPWVSHAAIVDGVPLFLKLDPLGAALMSLDWSATPMVRSPRCAAQVLLSPRSLYSPEELHAKLGPESALVTYQHNPPFWSPPENVRTPMLVLAAEKDAAISEPALRRSAAFYKADYIVVNDAGHNLMMEPNYRETAEAIHMWLVAQAVE